MSRSDSNVKKRRTYLAVGFLTVALAASLIFFNRRAEEPDVVAEKVLLAVLSGDANTLMHYQHEHEKVLLKLSKKQVQGILFYIDSVLLSGASKKGTPIKALTGTTQGIAHVTLSSSNRDATFDVVADRTDMGPRVCISLLLLKALSVRAVMEGKSSEGIDWRVHRTAVAEVMAEHAPALESLGITGYVGNNPEGRVVPFETYIRTGGGALTQR